MAPVKEDRLNSTYNALISVALKKHPIDKIATHIDDRFMGYGTANDEKIFGIDGFTWMVERQWEEMDVSRTEIKQHPVSRQLFNGGNSALIVEEIELLVHDDEETVPMSFRLSTLLEYNYNKWMILHFHGSIGDANTLEGSAWPIEELKRRNIELEQQVAEKTADLIRQNRELEIEAALEKVRTRTLLMKDSGELNEAVAVFFQQFQQLDLLPTEARTYFCNINQENRVAEVWMTEADGKVMSGSHHTPLDKSPSLEKYFDAWVSREPYMVRNYSGKELEEYLSFVSSLSHVKTDKDYQKIFQSPPDRIVMTDATFKQGCIGVMTFEPLSDEALEILVRFAKVFEFTYTRFLDLQKAEAQAREAQVEAALERVRSRSIAMHKTDELEDVSIVLYEELRKLGFQFFSCGFTIVMEEEAVHSVWNHDFNKGQLTHFLMPLEGDNVLSKRYRAWKEGTPIFQQELHGKKLNTHLAIGMPDEFKKEKNLAARFNIPDPCYFTFANFSKGYLHVLGRSFLPEEHQNILTRLSRVFEQSYIRYLDLKKAEEQAREAEIQLALERVRARTMAMQSSEELSEAAFLLAQQVRDLGIEAWGCAFHIYADDPDGDYEWFSNEDGYLPFYKTPRKKFFNRFYDQRDKGESLYIEEFTGKKCKDHYDYLLSLPVVGDALRNLQQNGMSLPQSQIDHAAYLKYGYLLFITHEPVPEAHEIFIRFASEFEKTYTRFLDLKKAEEQAREARIEASLEKVRAQSMGMHKSDELRETVGILYKEIKSLGFETPACTIVLYDESNQTVTHWVSGFAKNIYPQSYTHPYFDHPYFHDQLDAWKSGVSYKVFKFEGRLKKSYDKQIFSLDDMKHFPEDAKNEVSRIEKLLLTDAFMKYGMLEIFSDHALDEENVHTLKRFAKVFEQTYTRFLDLQKAEEQAREAQIEAALERVRSRTMAMQDSEELSEVAALLFNELKLLGANLWSAGFTICKEDDIMVEKWMGNPILGQMFDPMLVPYNADHGEQKMYDTWKNGTDLYSYVQDGKELSDIYEHLMTIPTFSANIQRVIDAGTPLPVWQKNHIASYKYGYLLIITTEEFEEEYIFPRFAKVFEQTYTRFLDLQKAEEQAREAQIEAALERVRARTMSMQSSDDLLPTSTFLLKELRSLGQTDLKGLFGVSLIDEEKKQFISFISDSGGPVVTKQMVLPVDDHWLINDLYDAWKKARNNNEAPQFLSRTLSRKQMKEWIEKLKEYNKGAHPNAFVDDEILNVADVVSELQQWTFDDAFYKQGMLFYQNVEPLSDEFRRILIRFANVFEQTYTRFLDLQKAEEQSREAQIEAALERVRARSMGMQQSEDLNKVLITMFEELRKLKFELERCVIWVFNEEDKSFKWHSANPEAEIDSYRVPYYDYQVINDYWEAWENRISRMYYDLSGDLKRGMDEYLFKRTEMANMPDEVIKGMTAPEQVHIYSTFNDFGALFCSTIEHQEEEIFSILERFGNAFNQAYTRFLDLQKAEGQAREAQIEAALERIRSRSMAMQSSDELSEVVRVMYDEIEKLKVSKWGCLLMTFDEENQNIRTWFSEIVNKQHARAYDFDNLNHKIVRKWWKFWESDEQILSIYLKDEEKHEFDRYLFTKTGMKNLPDEVKKAILSEKEVYFEYVNMKHGLVEFIDNVPLPEDSLPVLQRITWTFEQAYTRFLDVQRAEKLALETSRQSSLDRIRAEIASMRSMEDLQQITTIVWDELKTLGIPFIRCGVFIIDEENEVSHTYLSTSQGDPIAAMHLPFEEIPLVKNAVSSWKQKTIYTEHWDESGFREWTQNLIEGGFIQSKKKYEAGSPPETLDLHLLPFKHGMLYIGNTEPLSQEELNLGQSMANAFSVAYDRYEDFNKLEQAKKKIEEAFRELEAAQEQLIQQEKLASLGQLTAGIAHEIKNPLNFVNNFSDLSLELVDEAREEVKRALTPPFGHPSPSGRGDGGEGKQDEETDLILDILDDIENNLRKIHEHGTRADGIVKSMLQHSRGGSGKVEPTNVNALIKEYANLAFHGMRARKDPINVDIELDLDENVGEVEIIGEDFSRVVLNLCNNAFDAMREKANSNEQIPNSKDYQPKLTVRTKSVGSTVIIEVEDNGPGIPEEIQDKILQPFFTTKKGTAGTGLGLSITNDIIKAHGGILDIETKENKFTRFIIHLNQ